MGHDKLKDGRYRIVARVRKGDRILHKQQTVACSKEKAKALFEQFKKDLRENTNPKRSLTVQPTFGEALTFFLDRHTVGKSEFYFEKLKEDLGSVLISDLSERFDKYIQLLKVSKVKRTGEPVKNATINQYILRGKSALSFFEKHDKIKANPLKRFSLLKTVPRDVSLSPVEQQRLLDVIEKDNPHLYAIVKYALQVPCRKSELINMKVEDLDLFNGLIRVRSGTTKNDLGVYKPIPPDMLEYFRSIPKESDYLFYRKNKRGYHRLGDFKKAWMRSLKNAELTGITFHDTRHISASALVDSGTPERVVMQVAGWKTNMLTQYYHKSKESLKLVRFSGQCDSECDSEQEKTVASG